MPPHLHELIGVVIRAAAAKAAREAGYWEVLVREGEDEANVAWGDARSKQAAQAALDEAIRDLEAAIHEAIKGVAQ